MRLRATSPAAGSAASAKPKPEPLDPALRRLSAIILLGVITSLLDTTIVTVAIGTLGKQLHTSVDTIQWVNTGYLLALGAVIPLTGWSIGRFGAKRMWMVTLVLFMLGSALSGMAWSAGSLIAFRVIQGLGGGMMLPLAQAIIAQAAGPGRLGRAMAIVSIPAQVAPIVGPVIGGVIVSDLDWRWIFYINLPVCLAAVLLAWRGMPASAPRKQDRLDVTGFALLSPGIAAIVYGFSEAGSHRGFTTPWVLVPLLAGCLLLTGFALHTLRVREIQPVFDIRLFAMRSFSVSSAVIFIAGFATYGAMLILPLYYQDVRGQSPLRAGLLLAPQGAGTMLALSIAGRLSDRIGPRYIVLTGVVVTVVGTLAFAFATTGTNEALLGVSQFVRGAGVGATTVPVAAAAYRGLSKDRIPRATGGISVTQRIGASFGTAVVAVVLQRQIQAHGATAGATAAAFRDAFWLTIVFTVVMVGAAVFLPATPASAAAGAGGAAGAGAGAAGGAAGQKAASAGGQAAVGSRGESQEAVVRSGAAAGQGGAPEVESS